MSHPAPQESLSTARRPLLPLLLMLFLAALLLPGCAQLNNLGLNTPKSEEATAEESHPEPYHPAEFRDLLIPSELDWARDKSMVVNTESYAGGVLFFSGRVEINSLTDFFVNSMQKDGWKMVGSVKYKDVLLAFTKPHKTCTIIINGSEMGSRANVSVYITEDIAGLKDEAQVAAPKTAPFTF